MFNPEQPYDLIVAPQIKNDILLTKTDFSSINKIIYHKYLKYRDKRQTLLNSHHTNQDGKKGHLDGLKIYRL